MLLFKRGYKKQFVYGGSGLFSPVNQVLRNIFSSKAANQLGSAAKEILQNSSSDVVKKMSIAGKNTIKAAGKAMVNKTVDKGISKLSQINDQHFKTDRSNPVLKERVNSLSPVNRALLNKMVQTKLNVNNIIDGSGQKCKAITIQDFVRSKKGSGLKTIY